MRGKMKKSFTKLCKPRRSKSKIKKPNDNVSIFKM